jgi:hypothetical protein
MRTSIAAFLVASLFTALAAPGAQAASTQVNVRIEGKARTLFEGPISTAPHKVRSSSDSQWRRCNGINVNAPWNIGPGVVPTSASADAMRIVSETFDGAWYGQYEDYFVTRWGPDAQDVAQNEYWGLLVNNVFTSVGGCQYKLDDGDEVTWVYDAFDGRTRLGLYPADYSGGATPLTATAEVGQPFEVEVDGWSAYAESTPPATPQRTGSSPFQGAVVAPVETGEKGFEQVEVESPEAVATGAGGTASLVFTSAGWHRIKATAVDSQGAETVVRSNRLDVCVLQPPASDCGPPPVEDQVRTPPPPVAGEEEGEGEGGEDPDGDGPAVEGSAQGLPAAASPGVPRAEAKRIRLGSLRIDRSRIARGLVGVGWRVLDPGPGIEKWTISSKKLGGKGRRWVSRASGAERTSTTVRLPAGAAYELRLTVVDPLGRSSSASIGAVRMPG